MHKIKDVFKYVARKEIGDRGNRMVEIVDGNISPEFKDITWQVPRYGRQKNRKEVYYAGQTCIIEYKNFIGYRIKKGGKYIVVGKEWLAKTISEKYPHLIGHILK